MQGMGCMHWGVKNPKNMHLINLSQYHLFYLLSAVHLLCIGIYIYTFLFINAINLILRVPSSLGLDRVPNYSRRSGGSKLKKIIK